RVRPLQALGYRSQIALRLSQAKRGLQSSSHGETPGITLLQKIGLPDRGNHSQGNVQRGLPILIHPCKSLWGHAHNGELFSIETDSLANGARIGSELLHPHIVAEHYHCVAARRLILIEAETAAQVRLHTQRLKEVAGDKQTKLDLGQCIRLLAKTERAVHVCNQAVEALVLIAEVDVIPIRDAFPRVGWGSHQNLDDLAGM